MKSIRSNKYTILLFVAGPMLIYVWIESIITSFGFISEIASFTISISVCSTQTF